MANTWLKFVSALQSKLSTEQEVAGRIILTSDSRCMYWDTDGSNRIEITDIIRLPDEAARTSLLTPFEKFYYVITTGALWYYHNNTWHSVGQSAAGNNTVVSPTTPSDQNENDTWLEVLP